MHFLISLSRTVLIYLSFWIPFNHDNTVVLPIMLVLPCAVMAGFSDDADILDRFDSFLCMMVLNVCSSSAK